MTRFLKPIDQIIEQKKAEHLISAFYSRVILDLMIITLLNYLLLKNAMFMALSLTNVISVSL